MQNYDKIRAEMKAACIQAINDLAALESRPGNKSAARRLRKFTTNMGSYLGKDFRKASIKAEREAK